jgi:N-acetyltransferase 10
VVVGDRGKDVILNLHYILGSADPKQNKSVLWAYKKDLIGFTRYAIYPGRGAIASSTYNWPGSHRKKREAKIKKEVKRGIREANTEDPFELFISLTNIRYCYYKETEKILGNTYGMCILQDFEALTPNLLARTIETVEGGGLVILLLKTMTSLKQLYTMTMVCLQSATFPGSTNMLARTYTRGIGRKHMAMLLQGSMRGLSFP